VALGYRTKGSTKKGRRSTRRSSLRSRGPFTARLNVDLPIERKGLCGSGLSVRPFAILLPSSSRVKPITLRGRNSFRPHAYMVKQSDGSWKTQQCAVNFDWPGMKIGPGTIRFDKVGETPHVTICNGDLEAWNAWRAAQ
jgi:hypothetical protein